MSSYKTHSSFNLIIALPLLIVGGTYYLHTDPFDLGLFALAFIYGTFFMSPDMDLANQIKLFSVKGLLTIPFRSYAMVFRHRGISHSWLWGTVTRVLWFMLFIMVTMYVAYNIEPNGRTVAHYFQIYRRELLAVFCGLFAADFSHLLLDNKVLKKL